MNESLAEMLVLLAGLYLGIGLAFASFFVLRGVQRIDPAARGSGWGFRLAILPASAVLWPWLALRWKRGAPPPVEHNAHRDLAERAGRRGTP